MPKKHLAIIGNGMAGARLLQELLRRDAQRRYHITVFGEEPGHAYNRMLLSRVLSGEDPDTIRMEPAVEPHQEVTFHRSLRVDKLDTARRVIHTSDKREFAYDVAIFATGSKAFVPKLDGATLPDGSLKPGLFAYRSLDDCLQMRSKARAGDNAVVLGGGLLGLEAAKVLADTGMHVTVVHLMGHLMETQLDAHAGAMLQKQIERAGLFVRTGRTLKSILGGDVVQGVILDDGATLPADMVVLACGIRPRVDLAQASGLAVNRAIVVNDTLATQVPGVYAVGECAEHAGRVYGIVAPIFEQCAVLADVLTGASPKTRYRGSKLYAKLKVAGVDVASMGVVEPQLPTDEVVQIIEDRKLNYRKLIVRDGRLIGAHFVGDTTGAAEAVQAFDRDDTLPDHRIDVLMQQPSSANAGDRQVCNCNNVSESTIVQAIRNGATDVNQIGQCTRAGTGCGSCKGQLLTLLSIHKPVGSAT
jgi:nitrite reductase (NADH) large subunit